MSVGELKGRERAKAVEIVFWGLPLNCFLSVVAFLNNCLLCLCLCAANSNTSRNDIGERDLRLFRVTRAFPCRRYLFSLSLSLSLPVFFTFFVCFKWFTVEVGSVHSKSNRVPGLSGTRDFYIHSHSCHFLYVSFLPIFWLWF